MDPAAIDVDPPELQLDAVAAPRQDGVASGTLSCVECGTALSWTGRGRKPLYCSPRCRVRAHRARTVEEPALDLTIAPLGGGTG
jgi:hypothetical protein